VLGVVRRRFLVILIPALIVPGVALVLSLQQEKEYEASTSLLFRDAGPSVLASSDPDREAATNLRLLQLGVLEDRVNARLKSPFTGDVDVVTEAESNLATITVTDTDPERTARMANAFAQEYIALRQEAAREEVERELEAVRNALDEIPPAQATSTQARALQGRLRQLAVAAVAPSGARQVNPAEPPSSASSPDPKRNTVIGGLIGLALGIAFAIWLENRDRRVRDPRHIEALFGRPIIGRIPESRALAKSSPGTTALAPPEAEAFRTLRANLRHLLQERNARSTLVTSANPGDGKTTVAWNLARAEAASGARVLLVEADMRHPILSRSLGVDGAPGLSQLLNRDGRLQDMVQPIGFEDATDGSHSPGTVDVLFAGAHPPNPAELLGSERMRAVLDAVSDGYDLVVLDTPPASVVSDAMPILPLVGGVVVVGRLGLSTLESIVELRDQLEQLDAPTLGVVINFVVPNVYAYGY
jgi:succinoglycan biosynthesis transport protein ExoP